MITFAGQNWRVRNSNCGISSIPHPNKFSDSNANVWVDDNESLHLKITHVGEKWYCSEVVSVNSPHYGAYSFTVKGRLDLFDPNVAFGLFTWDTGTPQYNYSQMDFEFSGWKDSNEPDNAQYDIQPQNKPGNRQPFAFACSVNDVTTHDFTWRHNAVDFRSYYSDYPLSNPDNLIESWSYTGDDIPPVGGENIRIGLWLLPPDNAEPNTPGSPPDNGQEVEIVVKSFKMLGDTNKDMRIDDQDLISLIDAWLAEPGDSNWNPDCDLAQPPDEIINGNDFALFAQNWMYK